MPVLAGAGDGLIGRHHDAPDLRAVVQRLQRDDELRRRAVRIGDDVLLAKAFDRVGVHFRHDQRHVHVVAPGRGIIDDDAALARRSSATIPSTRLAAGRHQRDVGAGEIVVLERLHLQRPVAEGDVGALAAARGERHHLVGRKAALVAARPAFRDRHCRWLPPPRPSNPWKTPLARAGRACLRYRFLRPAVVSGRRLRSARPRPSPAASAQRFETPEHILEGFFEDVEPLVELGNADRQRHQALDHLVLGAGALDDQAALEGVGRHRRGELRDRRRARRASCRGPHLDQVGARSGRPSPAAARARCSPFAATSAAKSGVAPVVLERRRRGDEGVVVAAERAVVLARLPHVERALDQHDRERQAVAGDRLRQRHDVGLDAGRLRS